MLSTTLVLHSRFPLFRLSSVFLRVFISSITPLWVSWVLPLVLPLVILPNLSALLFFIFGPSTGTSGWRLLTAPAEFCFALFLWVLSPGPAIAFLTFSFLIPAVL